jgi:hypothetical protein
LRTDPRKELELHRYTPGLHKQSWKELQPCNVVLGPRGQHGWPDSGDLAGGLGRGSSRGGSRGHKEAICVLTRGGERAGGRARRRPAAAAAGSSTPANRRPGLANKRAWKLCGCKRKVGVARVGVASIRRVEFTVAAPMADGGSLPGPRRAAVKSTPFIGACALGRGSRYGARAVQGPTANGSPGAARGAYDDMQGSAGEVQRHDHWLGGGKVGVLGQRMRDAWRRGCGCKRRCEALGPAVTAVYRCSCPVGRRRGRRGQARATLSVGANQRGSISNGPVQTRISPNFPTKVDQGVNRKVVDLVFLYNFYKGRRVFSSTIFAQFACQDH